MTTTLLLALTLTAIAPEAPMETAAQAPAPAAPAASKIDDRFAAWIGCWRLEDDLTGAGARMCITPDQGGVRLQTIIGTQRGIDELVIPDGTARPIVDPECKGTEQSEWSRDGLRVFRSTQVVCGNDGPRTVASVAFLATGPSWINVQHVSGPAVSTSVRVQRYRRAINQNLADGTRAPQAPTMTTFPASSQLAWSVDDVIEANAKLPAEALQAALSDVRHGFNLNKQTLLALDEAGVDTSIIDLMVALTFPKRFVVERASGGGGGGGGVDPIGVTTGSGWFDPFMSPFIFGAYANCYFTPYGYGYRSYYDYGLCGGYAPYSYYRPYGYWGGGGYYPGGGWVVVNPDPGPIEPTSHGRVVNGRGYTQVRPRNPEPTVSRNGGSRGDGSAAGYSGGGSSGGSSGVTSSGYSNGTSGGGSSSGGDGGRTAVARPPGGH
jgi:hypothetical protein